MVPFPLQEQEGRLQAIQMLYAETGEHRLASEMTALRGLRESHPEMGAEELLCLNNQVLIMIAEYHLTSASQGSHRILPVIPEGAGRVQDYDIGPLLEYFLMPKLTDITLEEVALRVAQENRRAMEVSLRDLHDKRDTLENGIELLTSALDREQPRERRKSIKKQLDTRRKELHSNQECISWLEELLDLEQPQAQGSLNAIVEEITETTVVADEETESQATPLGGPTDDAAAPVRETEQDMETEGDGGDSPVTPNEDDLLTGAGTADVETGIASPHVDSPAKPRGNDDTAT